MMIWEECGANLELSCDVLSQNSFEGLMKGKKDLWEKSVSQKTSQMRDKKTPIINSLVKQLLVANHTQLHASAMLSHRHAG
jgi:hypothetical protein